VYTALNSTDSTSVTALATLLTIALALLVVALTGRLAAGAAGSPVLESPTRQEDGSVTPRAGVLVQG
jgi:hypothetical protein